MELRLLLLSPYKLWNQGLEIFSNKVYNVGILIPVFWLVCYTLYLSPTI